MKQKYEAGFSRRRAPPFTAVVALEVLQLRQLSPWIRWLYLELRMLSNFKTGELITSWAVLEAVMGCDDYQAFSPSREAVRRAIRSLAQLNLVELYPDAGTIGRQLFLKVHPIKGFAMPRGIADRPAERAADRPRTKQKASNGAALGKVDASLPTDLPTDLPTSDSEPLFQSPNPLSDAELSTGTNDNAARSADDARAAMKVLRNALAPRGGPLN